MGSPYTGELQEMGGKAAEKDHEKPYDGGSLAGSATSFARADSQHGTTADWSYRVVRTASGFALFEVGADGGDRCGPVAEMYYPTIEELKADVGAMLAAFDQPVLEDIAGKPTTLSEITAAGNDDGSGSQVGSGG